MLETFLLAAAVVFCGIAFVNHPRTARYNWLAGAIGLVILAVALLPRIS